METTNARVKCSIHNIRGCVTCHTAPKLTGREILSMETTHTPGPWELRDGVIYMHGNLPLRLVYGGDWCVRLEREAHARLIAAAPDLLAALREMVERFGTPASLELTGWAGVVENARAAIDKALGLS